MRRLLLLGAWLCHAATSEDESNTIHHIPLRRRMGTGRDMSHTPAPQDLSLRRVEFTRKESDGVYWTNIQLGTPPQLFSVIVDTGSSSIAVPCQGCDCGVHHNAFNRVRSSTVENTGRQYNQCYSEGSCNRGDLLLDFACFGNSMCNASVKHTFGCANVYASAFKAQEADGIVGLSNAGDTLLAKLHTERLLHRNMFAMCLGKQTGVLTVGGVYHRPLLEDFQYVGYSPQSYFYTVQVSSLEVNDAVVSTETYFPIIDSGSTFTYFPRALHEKVRSAIQRHCQDTKCTGVYSPPETPQEDIRDALVCYSVPRNFEHNVDAWLLQTFPFISFTFSNQARLCLSPVSYFFVSVKNVYCAGIFPDSGNKFVLGAISMSDHTVVFDKEHGRVGFAKANCDGDSTRTFLCCGKPCTGYVYPVMDYGKPLPVSEPVVFPDRLTTHTPNTESEDALSEDGNSVMPPPRLLQLFGLFLAGLLLGGCVLMLTICCLRRWRSVSFSKLDQEIQEA